MPATLGVACAGWSSGGGAGGKQDFAERLHGVVKRERKHQTDPRHHAGRVLPRRGGAAVIGTGHAPLRRTRHQERYRGHERLEEQRPG